MNPAPATGPCVPRDSTSELRDARVEARRGGQDVTLVPVEGGEPMPAEDQPAPAPGATAQTF